MTPDDDCVSVRAYVFWKVLCLNKYFICDDSSSVLEKTQPKYKPKKPSKKIKLKPGSMPFEIGQLKLQTPLQIQGLSELGYLKCSFCPALHTASAAEPDYVMVKYQNCLIKSPVQEKYLLVYSLPWISIKLQDFLVLRSFQRDSLKNCFLEFGADT